MSTRWRHLCSLPSLGATFPTPLGAVPSVDAPVPARPICKESLMRHPPRHPPRSGLLLVAAAVALVGTVVAPVVTASGAAPVCTVEYSVTSQWDAGFQGA